MSRSSVIVVALNHSSPRSRYAAAVSPWPFLLNCSQEELSFVRLSSIPTLSNGSPTRCFVGMSLSKIPFLLTGLITTYFVQTPPQAAVSADRRDKDVGTFENILAKAVPYNVVAIRVTAFALFVDLAY